MINSSYFDRTILASQSYLGKAILEDADTFARLCVQEFSLENYIALLCISAFNKLPDSERAQTFCEVFLDENLSPISINVTKPRCDFVVRLVTVTPTYKRNWRGINVADAPPQTVLNSLIDPLCQNLADTYSRYEYLPNRPGNRIDRLLHRPTKTRKVFKQQKPKSNQNLLNGLKILERGGWPVRHMSLSKVVIGF